MNMWIRSNCCFRPSVPPKPKTRPKVPPKPSQFLKRDQNVSSVAPVPHVVSTPNVVNQNNASDTGNVINGENNNRSKTVPNG